MISATRNKNTLMFFVKFFCLLLFIFALDYVIGSILRIFYFKEESGFQYTTTYSIEKTTAEVLAFGSSTANHSYEPDAFKEKVGSTFYNVGADGGSIFYDYAIFKTISKRYKPKIVILNFDVNEFEEFQTSIDQLSSLLPYYKNHPEIRSIIDFKRPNEKYKLISHIYPFNSSILTIAVGNTEFNKTRKEDIDGYVPLTEVWKEPIKQLSSEKLRLDSSKIAFYRSFIVDCIGKKIDLYIICPPLYIKFKEISNSVILGKKLAKLYNIAFFDYSQDSVFLNRPQLFADERHLNVEGAKAFSNEVAERILTYETKK